MRETLGPDASEEARRIWKHFLEARGEGFRVLFKRIVKESPEVARTAYTEVRQWRAQAFGWLDPGDFDDAIGMLVNLDDNSASSCAGRRRRRENGHYPPPDVDEGEPLFGPLEEFPELLQAVATTTPGHAARLLEAATSAELRTLDRDDLLPLLSSPSHDLRRAAFYALEVIDEPAPNNPPPLPGSRRS